MRVHDGEQLEQATGGSNRSRTKRRAPSWLDRPRSLAVAAALSLLGSGCSLVVDPDSPQCNTDADCLARGSSFTSTVCREALCVTNEADPAQSLECTAPTSSGLATVKYSFAIQLPTSGGATVPSFEVKACQQLDVDCQEPVAGPFDVPAGTRYDFPLPQGFFGFFQLVGTGTLPALYFLPRPVVTDTVGWSPTVLSQDVLAQLAGAAGVALDPSAGMVIASVRDCSGAAIAGATVSASEERAVRYYIVNNLPVVSATATSAQGAVGFANVPASTIALNGVSASGKAFAPVSVRVKSGALSLVELRP
jgi:hypothetical protein